MHSTRTAIHRIARKFALLIASVGVVALSGMAGAVDTTSGARPSPAIASAVQPNPLLSIDQNRTTVVDRVVADWGDALTESGAGLDTEQLRALLMGLRSDQLLAATLAGSLEGLRNVIATALTANAPVSAGLLHAKAFGDASLDARSMAAQASGGTRRL